MPGFMQKAPSPLSATTVRLLPSAMPARAVDSRASQTVNQKF
jgi:hypothetical protein